jgi:KDO2-lipid IV(A) lauroyltransferase
VWRRIAPRLYRQKRVLNNLALAYPDMPLDQRERIAAEMWDNLGRTFAESFRIRKIMEEGRIEFESQAQLDEMIRGGPCVVCGLHLGNWELVAYTGKLMGAPFTAVYQRLSNPYVDAATRKLRQPHLRWPPFAKNPGDGAGAPEDGEAGRLSCIPR